MCRGAQALSSPWSRSSWGPIIVCPPIRLLLRNESRTQASCLPVRSQVTKGVCLGRPGRYPGSFLASILGRGRGRVQLCCACKAVSSTDTSADPAHRRGRKLCGESFPLHPAAPREHHPPTFRPPGVDPPQRQPSRLSGLGLDISTVKAPSWCRGSWGCSHSEELTCSAAGTALTQTNPRQRRVAALWPALLTPRSVLRVWFLQVVLYAWSCLLLAVTL